MEYDVFIDVGSLQPGPFTGHIRSLAPGPRKYRYTHVRGRIARDPAELRGEIVVLRVRDSRSGYLEPQPWYLVIEEELPRP